MCMTTRPSEFHNMLVSITKAEIVYSKEYDGGTLYALIHTHPKKKHSTLDKNISAMDVILKTATKTSTTFFKSISPHYEGKVKTFENNEHIDDPLFHVIFNVQESGVAIGRKFNLQPDVHEYKEHQDPQEDINQEQLDLIFQKNDAEYSVAKSKRPRTEETDDGSSGSAMVVETVAQPVLAEIADLREELERTNGEITSLKNDIATKDTNIETLTTQNNDLQAASDSKDAKIAELELRPTVEAVNELRETKNKEMDDLKTKHTKDIEALVKQHTEEIDDRISEKKHMQEYINTKNAEVRTLNTTHTAAIDAKNVEINGLTATNTENINAKNTEIDDLKKKHDADLQALRDDATKKDDNLKELEEKLTAAQTTIATLEASAPAVVDQALRARAILAEQANEQLTRDLADMTERHRQAAYTAGDVRKQLNAANLKNADLTKTMRPR